MHRAQRGRLITALRHGQALEDATAGLGVDLRAVRARAAPTPASPSRSPARDPDTHIERGPARRADYPRLPAFGLPLSRADPGTGRPGSVAR
ncbi:hypothetical protein ABZX39_37155 [Streptomyces collinus]|uniref:hypothetical protein n=1 Tax=Streptomyces collinus TaxID=42684 RepID=UPI0033B7690B